MLAAVPGSALADPALGAGVADPARALASLAGAGVAAPAVEPDARAVSWSTLRRLALLGGEFLPPYRPVSNVEITATLRRAWERGGPGLLRTGSRRDLVWLLARHGDQRRPLRWASCACRQPRLQLSAGGRVGLRELGPGEVVMGEGGLVGRGLLGTLEPAAALWSGPAWAGATLRLELPLAQAGRGVAGPLRYAGWPEPTGRPAVGRARVRAVSRVTVPRAAAGVRLGGWSAAAGLFPATVGVGLDGAGLTLGASAGPAPQVVLRRARPFAWSGFMGPLAPAHVLLRAGSVSGRDVRYQTVRGPQTRHARPLLTQWLSTWNHTPWWRTTITGTALSVARSGRALWPDLLQVNLPLLDATWNETEYGPVTDRLVSLIMEARWREAPWPLLPAAAGRVWWEYGGEDYRPHGLLPLLPEIAAPANLAGVELVDVRWDLAVEFLDTRHPRVLWYGNSGFPDAYTHDGLLLGPIRGGAARSWTAVLRWRTAGGGDEWELRGRATTWSHATRLPDDARRREVRLGWRRHDRRGAWSAHVGWVEEELASASDHWWRAGLQRQF